MREKLREIGCEERHRFTATFSRFGTKNGFKGLVETVLLIDVKDANGNIVTNHLWFNKTKGFASLSLNEGDVVEFTARVDEYTKGYFGRREDVYKPIEKDYRLTYPTNIKRK